VAKLLNEVGADINAIRGDHRTPLKAAIVETKPEIIALLLNAGATVDL
jgi:hypothetical protein